MTTAETYEDRLAKQRLVESENAARTHAQMLEIAKHLTGWTVLPQRDNTYPGMVPQPVLDLAGTDGMIIHFSQCWKDKGRLIVSGAWPKDGYGIEHCPRSEDRPVITVGLSVDSIKVAKDIQRRFIPQYQAAYYAAFNQSMIASQRKITYEKTVQSLADRGIGRIDRNPYRTSGGNPSVYIPSDHPGYSGSIAPNISSCTAKLVGVNFTIFCEPELAEKIFVVLERWSKDHPKKD